MTPQELAAAYALSARPFIEAPGPVPESVLGLKAWRYVLEISSQCNLRCALCHAGNREGYQYKPGIMDMALMERILDKITTENPRAIVCAYVNSEPFLHPRLAECIASIKRRGLRCEVSSNLNFMRDLDAVLAARPDHGAATPVLGTVDPMKDHPLRIHAQGALPTIADIDQLFVDEWSE